MRERERDTERRRWDAEGALREREEAARRERERKRERKKEEGGEEGRRKAEKMGDLKLDEEKHGERVQ